MYSYRNNWLIWCSFLISIILQMMPCFFLSHVVRPSWNYLLLMYWVTTEPKKINIGTGFTIGLITDFIFGSILGIRALSLVIVTYLITCKFKHFRGLSIVKQTIIIVLLSLINKIIIFCLKKIIINIFFYSNIFWIVIVDGIFWPLISLLMNKMQIYFINKNVFTNKY